MQKHHSYLAGLTDIPGNGLKCENPDKQERGIPNPWMPKEEANQTLNLVTNILHRVFNNINSWLLILNVHNKRTQIWK